MSKKNKNEKKPQPIGAQSVKSVGTKAAADRKTAMTKKQKIFTVVAAILIVAIIAALVIWIVSVMTDDGTVDYMNDDLSKYITISKDDYSNIEVSGPFTEYTEEQLEQHIQELLAQNKSETPLYDGLGTKNVAVTLGDVVSIYFRGYTVDENGKQVEFAGNHNFTSEYPTKLEIGTGLVIDDSTTKTYFIPGFDTALIGAVPSDYEPFKKITEGNVEFGDVIYLTYTAFYPDNSGTYKKVTSERIDLLDENIDAKYGEGFTSFLLGTVDEPQVIGEKLPSKTFPYGDGSAGYSDMKIEFATRCERDPYTIDVTFPVNYKTKELRGVDAKFEVYINTAIIYDTPEFNEEFITETLKITADDLADYEGENTVEKYKNLLRKELRDVADGTNDDVIIDALWERFLDKVVVHELPKATVEEYYQSYYNEISAIYSQYSTTYSSIDECAVAQLGLSTGADWRAVLREQAEQVTLEKVIFYYIIRDAGLVPSDEEFEKLYNDIVQDHLDYYVESHADELKDLEGDAYDAEVAVIKREMMAYYGEDYFTENVYYNYGTEKMIECLAVRVKT